jgi:sodium/potassium-transporting ATPase subunit alpha
MAGSLKKILLICQIANLLVSRTRVESALSKNMFTNKMILLAIMAELLILSTIMFHPFANTIFGTAPVSMEYLVFAIPFAILLFVQDEIRKYYIRKGSLLAKTFLKW